MSEPRAVHRLVMVYNADSGFLNAMAESARKLLGGGGCTLCSLTHGLAGERQEWQECREELGLPVDHVHRDELEGVLAGVVGNRIPAVVAQTEDGYEILLSPEALRRFKGKTDRFLDGLRAAADAADLAVFS